MQEIIQTINEAYKKATGMIALMNHKEAEIIGQEAMDFIADYPLYAATSNISYLEAIKIAYVLDLFNEADKSIIKKLMK